MQVVTKKLPYSQYKYDGRVAEKILQGEPPGRRLDLGEMAAEPKWDVVWDLMEQCWFADPSGRPSTQDLLIRVSYCSLK